MKIDLPGATNWRSGLFGRARFAGAPRTLLIIPTAAVVRRGQLSFVFVAADGHARLRAVSLGESAATGVEVLDGLSAGEAVLLSPPATLTDGARITLTGAAR